MIKKILTILICLVIVCICYSQNNESSQIETENSIDQIEKLILYKELDSALNLINRRKETPYLKALNRILKDAQPTYSDYKDYITNLEIKPNIPYESISSFINENITEPKNDEVIDIDYVKIKWNQVSKLRNEVSIEEASKVQLTLEGYINRFNENDDDVRRAKILSSAHQTVLYIIQEEIDKGKQLCKDNFEKAKSLNDKELMIMSLYYLCDFIIHEGKLDEYISISEKSLQIENTLPKKSSYYNATLVHIIDAYIYKGGKDGRVNTLLKTLYSQPGYREQSFSLYAKYLGTLELTSTSAKNVFNQFKISNLEEFCKLTETEGSKVLNPNDLYHLLREISNTLQAHGYLKKSIYYKDKTIVQIKKIYSQDLANSLASYKAKEAIKEKDLIIAHQKERSNLYIVIAVLVAGLSLISIIAYYKKQKQSKILEDKNKQITKALKEKELLVKEVHHRVKNNFQIVSSLLELQTKGIKDDKVLNLAKEVQNRVRSMALIHQNLYQNKDGLIDFNEYLQILVNELTSLYSSSKNIKTNLNVEDIYFDIDTAIPLGLIVNELITNAYKHAFESKEDGELNISIINLNTHKYKLIVSDNGFGIHPEFNIKNAESVGLRLVNRLVKQIHGEIILKNIEGAQFEILFKDTVSRKVVL